MNPIEKRIRSVSDAEVCESARAAFPGKSDREIIAELTRLIVFVAVCWNDIVEAGQSTRDVLNRHVFAECEEIAQYFPFQDKDV